MPVPAQPKIYHIVHVDRLLSILTDGYLWCDAVMVQRTHQANGTTIGMNNIKQRRLRTTLVSYPQLHVGECVPFYFCPRSVMLYLIAQANHPELGYRDGQVPIIHFEVDLQATVTWAQQHHQRWAFTLSNAGSSYFEDRCNLSQLNELDWDAIQTNRWSGNAIPRAVKENKQAEFLLEQSFPFSLVSCIGVHSKAVYHQVMSILQASPHKPVVEIKATWYY